MKKLFLTVILFSTASIIAFGQQLNVRQDQNLRTGSSIVDDSTRQIYGPTTTRLFSLENIRYNTLDYQFVDTTVTDFDLDYDLLASRNYQGQDLGNLGTAWRPHFYGIPDILGARTGFNSFKPYYKDPKDFKLYDTRSPFTWFGVQWGGEGRNVTQVKYSRNVNERLNFTLDYKALLVDKIIGKQRRGDRNVESYNYSLSGWYRSSNLKYASYLILSRIRHNATEMGGVDVDPINGTLADFFEPTALANLTSTNNIELRRELVYYHRYELTKLVSIFHEVNWGSQENSLVVGSAAESIDYFQNEVIPFSGEAKDSTTFNYLTNKVGITGYTKGFNYELYLKGRNFSYKNPYLDTIPVLVDINGFETYTGINIGTTIDSTFHIRANGELQSNGNYGIKGRIDAPWLEARAGLARFDPGLMQQAYKGHYDFWNTRFDPILMQYLEGKIKLKFKSLILEPGIFAQSTQRWVNFLEVSDQPGNPQYLPTQNSDPINILSPSVKFGIRGKKAYALAQLKYNEVYSNSGSGAVIFAMAMPEYMADLDLGITNTIFNDNLIFQLGIRTHWQSSYFAQYYAPSVQQFYVKSFDPFEVPDYWFYTAYLNGRIGKVKFYLKFNNLRKLMNPVGYFPTPQYPGINSLFDFGFKWYFYD